MADTADRRSEGRVSSPEALRQRALASLRRSRGVCSYCGVTPVLNRVVCYACSDKTKAFYYKAQTRNHLKRYDIDDSNLQELINDLSVYLEESPLVDRLIDLLTDLKRSPKKG